MVNYKSNIGSDEGQVNHALNEMALMLYELVKKSVVYLPVDLIFLSIHQLHRQFMTGKDFFLNRIIKFENNPWNWHQYEIQSIYLSSW